MARLGLEKAAPLGPTLDTPTPDEGLRDPGLGAGLRWAWRMVLVLESEGL